MSEIALDGLVIFAKKECPTCNLVHPVARELAERGRAVTVFVQDDTSFMEGLPVEDDTSLKQSWSHVAAHRGGRLGGPRRSGL